MKHRITVKPLKEMGVAVTHITHYGHTYTFKRQMEINSTFGNNVTWL
jgi:hypothetical protein